MRIAELSSRSGVAVPTIKYYLRERLLPPGELTSPNQASYGEQHLRRLRLIRALVDLGQVPIAQVKEVLAAVDAETMPLHERVGAAHRAVTPRPQLTASDAARAVAEAEVAELIESRGWAVAPDAPALATLVETIAVFRTLGQDHLVVPLDQYAAAVERFTELEVAAAASRHDPDQLAESVVIGTVLGQTLIAALRLLAQENASARLLGQATARPDVAEPGRPG